MMCLAIDHGTKGLVIKQRLSVEENVEMLISSSVELPGTTLCHVYGYLNSKQISCSFFSKL